MYGIFLPTLVVFAKDHNLYNNFLFGRNSHFVAGLGFDHLLQYQDKGDLFYVPEYSSQH